MNNVPTYRLPPEPPTWVHCGLCAEDTHTGNAIRFDTDGPERWVCLPCVPTYSRLRVLAVAHPEMWDSAGSVADLARWYEVSERAVRWAAEGLA